jgi:ABC-type transporter Mla MlaB component
MWKITKVEDGKCLVLSVSGRLEAEELFELQRALLTEQEACQKVELDLQGVRLVDHEVVSFLACCEAGGTKLRNCPPYIREWIGRERNDGARNGEPGGSS